MTRDFIFDHAPFAACHASTIIEAADGSLLAAWFGGTAEGKPDVGIWLSRRAKAGPYAPWSPPVEVAREPGVPCWNPVLYRDVENTVWLFYKVGENPLCWTGAYLISRDCGESWSAPVYLPAGLLGPIKNKPIPLSDGALLSPTSVESYRAWACWMERRSPAGEWSKHGPIVVPDQPMGVIQPTVVETEPRRVIALMRSTQAIGRVCRAVSDDGGRSWSPALPTPLPNPNSGIDAVLLRDGRIALAYNHTTDARTPLNVAVSSDEGLTWSTPVVLESEPGEFSYPAIIQAADGAIHVTYTHRRSRIAHVVTRPEEL